MSTNVLRNVVLCMLGFACSAACGDELSDLVTRLQKLEGKNAIHGAVHIEDRTSGTQDNGFKQFEADFVITADANTLTVTYPGDISKIAADPNAGTSTYTGDASNVRIFQEFTLLRTGELANYGPTLARELDGLKLVKKSLDQYEGTPCTLWILNSKQTQKTRGVKATTQRNVELWTDAEGYPIAGSFKTQMSAKIILIFNINSESLRQQRYERFADRLVLTLDKNETDLETDDGDVKRTVTTKVEVKK